MKERPYIQDDPFTWRVLTSKTALYVGILACVTELVVVFGQDAPEPTKPDATKTDAALLELSPLEKELSQADLNQNGKLEASEQGIFRVARAQQRADRIRKWDKNGDGVLSDREIAAARVAWRKAMKERKAAERIATPPGAKEP